MTFGSRISWQKVEQAFQARPEVGLVFSDAEVVDENLSPLGHLSDHFGAERQADLWQLAESFMRSCGKT